MPLIVASCDGLAVRLIESTLISAHASGIFPPVGFVDARLTLIVLPEFEVVLDPVPDEGVVSEEDVSLLVVVPDEVDVSAGGVLLLSWKMPWRIEASSVLLSRFLMISRIS